MENNTDARKAAEQFYESQRKLGFTESITSNDRPDYTLPFYQSIFSLMLEFAQSRPAALDNLSEDAISNKCYDLFFNQPGDMSKSQAIKLAKEMVRWRESLS